MKLDTFEKARILGEDLAASAEFKKLQRAQAIFDADPETQRRMEALERLTGEIQSLDDEFVTLKRLEELKAEVAMLRSQIDTSAAVTGLLAAKEEFQSLMDEVNEVVRFVISGERADAYHAGCAGCQGCHQVH